jgi:hypothetical protein
MSHDLGLHIDCSTWNIPAAVKRRRRRIWWAAYMQDKWYVDKQDHFCCDSNGLAEVSRFAMALGRPSYLNDANTTTLMLTEADFEDCGPDAVNGKTGRPELITGIRCFVAMAELSVILKEVLSIFFTLGSVVSLREVTGEHIIDSFHHIEANLDKWRAAYLDQILGERIFPDVTGS